jgi:hypothetical protein
MPNCVHYWRLPSPNGPRIPGVCLKCGAERDFPATAAFDPLGQKQLKVVYDPNPGPWRPL